MKKIFTEKLLIFIILIALNGFTLIQDNNPSFKIVRIGTREWMAENLNVGNFRNGDPIFEANSYQEWEYANIKGIPAWCYYNNNPRYGKTYGKLYNWWAVSDSRGLAPEGWHIPGDEEWLELAANLGGVDIAGEKMKSRQGWKDSGNGNNESGFRSSQPSRHQSNLILSSFLRCTILPFSNLIKILP